MTAAARGLVDVDWPAPPQVRSFSTSRRGGVSRGPFDALNLSASAGDDPARVAENVDRLCSAAGLPQAPRWPRQVHGARVVEAGALAGGPLEADAVYTTTPGAVCTIRTADCLPVLLCDDAGSVVAAAHAGWRGLAAGVLEATVAALPAAPERLIAWLGPAIGARAYEVGDDVRDAFVGDDPGATAAFAVSPRGRWLADLYLLARRRLAAAGIDTVHGGGWCTASDPARFFSYRRDGVTGRMATGIWIDAPRIPSTAGRRG